MEWFYIFFKKEESNRIRFKLTHKSDENILIGKNLYKFSIEKYSEIRD